MSEDRARVSNMSSDKWSHLTVSNLGTLARLLGMPASTLLDCVLSGIENLMRTDSQHSA